MILSDFAIKNKIAVFSATVFFAIAGTFCYLNLPRENFPDITVPYVFVSTRYEGVAPQEIENLITIPLEKKMKGLDKVKEISSSSAESSSNITIEFYPDQDIDSAVQKVKDKVDLAREDLPDDIDEPIVSEVNLSTDIPIMSIAFYGTDSLALLKKTVEDIRDKIETIPGVLEASIFGDREREIRVEVDIKRLNSYGIPALKLIQLLTKENATVSAGTLDMLGTKFQIRIPGEFARPDEINSLIVSRSNSGYPIYLTDFSKVSDTYKDIETISRVGTTPCISLMIQKRSGANIIKVIKEIKKTLDSESRKIPSGIKWKITSDLSKDTYQMIYELENNIISGLILVLAVLYFAMGLRNSFFVALAIPLSMMIAFMIMCMQGITLNMMVLFSLILSLGMLVDNGIVIVENIYRHRCNGMTAVEASKTGASEVAWPVITSTLTTTVAFIPLLSWPDMIGKFMSFLPKTVILTLSASLFVGIIVNPAICSVMIKPATTKKTRGIFRITDWIGKKISVLYENSLKVCLAHPFVTNLIGVMIFIFVVMLFGRYGAGVELFPDADPRRTSVQVKFPEGTEISRTDELMKEIEKRIKKYEDIEYTLTTVGRGAGNFFKGGDSGPHLGSVQIEFKDFDKRKYSSTVLSNAIRMNITGIEYIQLRKLQNNNNNNKIEIRYPGKDAESLKILLESIIAHEKPSISVEIDTMEIADDIPSITVSAGEKSDKIIAMIMNETRSFPGAEIIVKNEQEGPPSGAPISIEISGDDFEILSQIAEKIKSEIKNIPGLADLRDDYEKARPELKFTVDRTRAALLGLDTGTIADFIRTAINGLEVTKYREGEEEYDITIRLPEEQRIDSKALLGMQIPIPGHPPVALSSLGKFEYSRGYGTIRRKNYDRTITLDADAKPGYGVDEVLNSIIAKLNGFNLPPGYRIKYRGENEDQQENFEFLLKAFFIAIGLIAIILILQFNSVLLPLIILVSVVLSFIGVLGSLLLFNMRFSIIMTGLGVICLAGVVVNNSIVLIDCILQQKAKGQDSFNAALTAGQLRLRPVLLTAITTILGLIPMAVGWSLEIHSFPPKFTAGAESSQWWAPMAIVVIFGLAVSTFLTLFYAPCLFKIIDSVFGKKFEPPRVHPAASLSLSSSENVQTQE